MLLLQILTGIWRAVLLLPDAELPFNFELNKIKDRYEMVIHNADERIVADEITVRGDSLYIKLPVYESQFRLLVKGNTMSGDWINYSRKEVPVIRFKAEYNNSNRFIPSAPPALDVNGRWETWMDVTDKDSSLAIGIFRQQGDKVTGTFLTPTGDHRYLEGSVSGDTLWLSTFDGSHCWLYRATADKNRLDGTYWSGNHYQSKWYAVRNTAVQLPDADKITTVEHPLSFSFPDADSNMVSISDDRFRNKALIIQVMGTWCPNCLDESKFLSEFYRKNRDKGVEIIGLDFEKTTDFSRISTNIKRLKERLKIDYAILYAGSVGKEEVMKQLPGLENFRSYPTTIYINRKGEVVKVHSGFSGPATGSEYEKFSADFNATVESMLK
jgi:thiol-disulfide isomerase/thioredoxin